MRILGDNEDEAAYLSEWRKFVQYDNVLVCNISSGGDGRIRVAALAFVVRLTIKARTNEIAELLAILCEWRSERVIHSTAAQLTDVTKYLWILRVLIGCHSNSNRVTINAESNRAIKRYGGLNLIEIEGQSITLHSSFMGNWLRLHTPPRPRLLSTPGNKMREEVIVKLNSLVAVRWFIERGRPAPSS